MDPASGYTLGSSGIIGGDCPIRTDGAISDSAVLLLAEGDSIELLPISQYYGFQDRLRSQPQHPPILTNLSN